MATKKVTIPKVPGRVPGRPILSVRVDPKLEQRIVALAEAEGLEIADWHRAALLAEVRRQERAAR